MYVIGLFDLLPWYNQWEKSKQKIKKCTSLWNNIRSRNKFPTMWYMRPAKAKTSLRIRIVWSEPLRVDYSMTVKLLTKHHLEFLSLKGGYTCSSESTLVKVPQCWKSHVTAHMSIWLYTVIINRGKHQTKYPKMHDLKYVYVLGLFDSNPCYNQEIKSDKVSKNANHLTKCLRSLWPKSLTEEKLGEFSSCRSGNFPIFHWDRKTHS